MYWTLELASKLEDAPWPATKDELIDYAMRSGAPLEVIENLQEICQYYHPPKAKRVCFHRKYRTDLPRDGVRRGRYFGVCSERKISKNFDKVA